MNAAIIWLNEQTLRLSNPVFSKAPKNARPIFIWDDEYFQNCGYSLKRLVFIYETLCELSIEIIHGKTLEILVNLKTTELFIPVSNNSFVRKLITQIPKNININLVEDDNFVIINDKTEFKRFFQYWNKAKKTAFIINGGFND